VRARLALMYATLFLVAGSALLALTYGLLASRLPAPTAVAPAALHRSALERLCKQVAEPKPGVKTVIKPKTAAQPVVKPKVGLPPQLVAKCKEAFNAGARVGSKDQRRHTLETLLDASLIGLGIATLVSAGIGWLISGRVLAPIRSITETANRASELQLGARIALAGPADELKELADTFDRMLARLDATFAAQRRFMADAAHELRTPLTAMRTAIDVTLAKPDPTSEQLAAMAARVRRSIARAEATIEALLTLATSEQPLAVREPVDLALAAEDALDDAAGAIAERHLVVDASLDAAATAGDRVLLERLVANLVDNAVRHNFADGWVALRTYQRDGLATFEIENTGPVVAPDQVDALTQPFGRAERRADPLDGVGLGLSIARAIAVAHGASMSVRARAGGGLLVTLSAASAAA
jgi:signal transduction histidine kinase